MVSIAVKNFGVCDFSRFGGYGLALAALALMTAIPMSTML